MPAQTPGSFTKQFGWGSDRGLAKLHEAIRKGYQERLMAVDREQWRKSSGIKDTNLELIPINFYLHNRQGRMSVDELVYQAVQRPHSIRFDRLALFALHLNRVGEPPLKGPGDPILWAREFVDEVLWQNGQWRRGVLTEADMDRFFDGRIDAIPQTRQKCRSNYRNIFEISGFLDKADGAINTGIEDWVGSALFLAWDRHLLDRGAKTRQALLNLVANDALHKPMGTTKEFVAASATDLVDSYLEAGDLSRFLRAPSKAPAPKPAAPAAPGAPAPKPAAPAAPGAPAPTPPVDPLQAELLEEEGTDDAIGRRLVQVRAQKRNRGLAARLRLHYQHTCQFCRARLQVGDGVFYAEAAHIRPLGKPHDGPDKAANLLVLCPNHHLQFDRGILRLKADGTRWKLVSKIAGDPLHDKLIRHRHKLDATCVRWHWDWFNDTLA